MWGYAKLKIEDIKERSNVNSSITVWFGVKSLGDNVQNDITSCYTAKLKCIYCIGNISK